MEQSESFDVPALKAHLLEKLAADAHVYPLHIEQQFPRILAKIVELWGSARLDDYLGQLMVSDRQGRRGFPGEVAMDLFRLSTVHGGLGFSRQTQGTGWAGIDDHELFKKEFVKGNK